ncbi:mitochondrial genome maintenance MGM101-domain-containing protein [Aspergillus egyptiacus]|nr:mitochondrial genome maintenance MGM101-domain-containing protein [Aspergillus egyptiacus]
MAFLRTLQAAEPLLQRPTLLRSATRSIPSRRFPQSTLHLRSRSASTSTSTPAPAPQTQPARQPPTASPSTPQSNSSSSSSTAARAAAITQPPPSSPTTPNIAKTGLSDKPLELESTPAEKIDWTRSFHGLSAEPFPKEAADILLAETDPGEVEIKPDGILYLPEIKYRRILNRAFGPGGWGLVPRSESIVTPKTVTREYALVCHGRLVSVARGEQDYFSPDGIPTATEGCRSNALVRCCKDLGIASELWDPRWIRKFKAQYTREVWVEHVVNKRKSKIWVRKEDPVPYPYKET